MELKDRMSIPTIIPIGKNFAPGKGIKIRCMVTPGTARLSINLCCGPDVTNQENAALHVLFDLVNRNTTINSKQKGAWGEECFIPDIPFNYGENVEVLISCDQFNYKIFINGRHYKDFKQNISHDYVTFVAIEGDVIIEQILLENFLVSAPCAFYGVMPYPLHQTGSRLPPDKMSPDSLQSTSYDPSAPLNATPCNWPMRSSRWKIYTVYSGIALIVIVILLCGILIPRVHHKKHEEYDFD